MFLLFSFVWEGGGRSCTHFKLLLHNEIISDARRGLEEFVASPSSLARSPAMHEGFRLKDWKARPIVQVYVLVFVIETRYKHQI